MQNTEFNRLKLKTDRLYLPLSGGKVDGETIFTKKVTFGSGKKAIKIHDGKIEGLEGGEGHTYDLTQSTDNTEITLTEDGADKTTVRAMRTTAEVRALMLELCYPVGSIYISTKNVSPQTFLGGTWKSKSGYVLRGATSGVNFNSNTNDGGADSVTVSSVANHNHTQNQHQHNIGAVNLYYASGGVNAGAANQYGQSAIYSTGYTTATNIANGADYTVNTLPKYKNVYIWERTA